MSNLLNDFDTDHLVIGAGATGLAFADTLLQESSGAHITLVDRHALPGGHWNDAYPFVRLHQPSAFYGVNSLPLGTGRKDTVGPNAGLYELASGAEVCAYFQQVLQQLLASGRVRHLGAHAVVAERPGEVTVRSTLSGATTTVRVRQRVVDACHFSPDVPATTPPRYAVADGVTLLTPTAMAQWGQGPGPADRDPPPAWCVLGAGKTAMDAAVWLLQQGVPADRIHWVVPRDSWIVNRLTTQPGEEFFEHSIGGQVQQFKALAQAATVEDLFERLEATGQMLRIDRSRTPGMFHYATISEGEVALLRQIGQVVRLGRVQAVEREALVLQQGRVAMPAGTAYIDCTASAVRPKPAQPMFQPGRIVPQLVRAPLVTFSAAVCAWVDVHVEDDAQRNRLCAPVPFPQAPGGWIVSSLVNLSNQMRWSQHKALRQWMRDSRLDGFGKMTASVPAEDTARRALLDELRQQAMAAMMNAPRLLGATGLALP